MILFVTVRIPDNARVSAVVVMSTYYSGYLVCT